MALTPEQIDAEAFARWGEMKGAPLAMCRGFARAIEAEVRKDALEEAAKLVAETAEWKRAGWTTSICPVTKEAIAESIRKLKEDIQ